MERHAAKSAEQNINEPGEEEASHSAEKGLAEQVLEAFLGAEGEAMLERAEAVGRLIEKMERAGGLFG